MLPNDALRILQQTRQSGDKSSKISRGSQCAEVHKRRTPASCALPATTNAANALPKDTWLHTCNTILQLLRGRARLHLYKVDRNLSLHSTGAQAHRLGLRLGRFLQRQMQQTLCQKTLGYTCCGNPILQLLRGRGRLHLYKVDRNLSLPALHTCSGTQTRPASWALPATTNAANALPKDTWLHMLLQPYPAAAARQGSAAPLQGRQKLVSALHTCSGTQTRPASWTLPATTKCSKRSAKRHLVTHAVATLSCSCCAAGVGCTFTRSTETCLCLHSTRAQAQQTRPASWALPATTNAANALPKDTWLHMLLQPYPAAAARQWSAAPLQGRQKLVSALNRCSGTQTRPASWALPATTNAANALPKDTWLHMLLQPYPAAAARQGSAAPLQGRQKLVSALHTCSATQTTQACVLGASCNDKCSQRSAARHLIHFIQELITNVSISSSTEQREWRQLQSQYSAREQ